MENKDGNDKQLSWIFNGRNANYNRSAGLQMSN